MTLPIKPLIIDGVTYLSDKPTKFKCEKVIEYFDNLANFRFMHQHAYQFYENGQMDVSLFLEYYHQPNILYNSIAF